MEATLARAINKMTIDELVDYEGRLWATYHMLPMSTQEDIVDVGRALRLISRAQERQKELRERCPTPGSTKGSSSSS